MSGKKFRNEDYTLTQVEAPSFDGESIPITLIHKHKLKMNRRNKLLLHGYGHYGLPLDPEFNVVYLSALEEGWILAFAHVRGGNEKGQQWHKQAVGKNKSVTYRDFIACAECLVAQRYTHPSLMCAFGSSAGGTLIGSVINIRPNLFKAVILHYPFLDVLSSMLDPAQPLTTSDYDEFGNPQQSQLIYDNISSYSPYENINKYEYPAVFIQCGSDDYRAPLWNVMKYVQKFRQRVEKPLRTLEVGDKNIFVSVFDSGHLGEASISSGVKEKAQYLAFLDYFLKYPRNKDITNGEEEIDEEKYLKNLSKSNYQIQDEDHIDRVDEMKEKSDKNKLG